MGGVASRFDENDWTKANGKLQSREETIDGAPPTSEYGVYSLVKRNNLGVGGQREFDFLDSDSNLIYTARAVEGTIAWFDVLGPGMDDYRIRVQVDLTRRFWIFYAFGKPTFVGQLPDGQATKKAFSDTSKKSLYDGEPFLYRKACMAVTWARFEGIVSYYGPPPHKKLQKNKNENSLQTNAPSSEDYLLIGSDNDNNYKKDEHETTTRIDSVDTGGVWLEDPQPELVPTSQLIEMLDTTTITSESSAGVLASTINFTDIANGSTSTLLEPFPKNGEDSSLATAGKRLEDPFFLLGDSTSTLLEPFPKVEDQTLILNGSHSSSAPEMTSSVLPSTSMDGAEIPTTRRGLFRSFGSVLKNKASLTKKSDPTDESTDVAAVTSTDDNTIPKEGKGRLRSRFSYENLRTLVQDKVQVEASNPQEGVLMSHIPILKVQEIQSFTGKHQTLLPTLEDYRRMQRRTKIDNNNNNATNNVEKDTINGNARAETDTIPIEDKNIERPQGSLGQSKEKIGGNTIVREYKEDASTSGTTSNGDVSLELATPPTEMAASSISGPMLIDFVDDTKQSENAPASIDDQSTVRNDVHIDGTNDLDESLLRGWHHSSKAEGHELQHSNTEEHAQPLVGFWSWENTLVVHKMTMHVAKGSDLALHVILAIVTNQLRYERNAAIATSM